MTKKEVKTTEEVKAPAEAKEIIRGRMPLALVFLMRFGENKDAPVAEAASTFATTVGKVTDIRKGNNFAYVTESYKPTQADIDLALERMDKHPRYDAENIDAVVEELTALVVATADEEAAFAEVKKTARAQSSKTKDGDEANAGGGNNSGAKSDDVPEGDDLLE